MARVARGKSEIERVHPFAQENDPTSPELSDSGFRSVESLVSDEKPLFGEIYDEFKSRLLKQVKF